ncbi:hypothetical protein Leryth_026577 [Lithospermum erythrorhizon]|nr:hypothetical protein Leryth_026577 [Lithospermum erythrorhizon]
MLLKLSHPLYISFPLLHFNTSFLEFLEEMVKFAKELEAQRIPEWKEAFVNYKQLKKHVKKIKQSRVPKHVENSINDCGRSVFDPVLFVVRKITSHLHSAGDKPEIIQVKCKIRKGEIDEKVGEGEDEDEVLYHTELTHLFSAEDEVKVFFETLDMELNKVNQFYKAKEAEFLERGEALNKQLQILHQLKQILSDRRRKNRSPMSRSFSFSRSFSSSGGNSDFSESPGSEYCDSPTNNSETNDDEVIASLEKNGINFVNSATRTKTKSGKPKMGLRIDIPNTTPTLTISSLTSILEELVNNPKKDGSRDYINRKKIQCAEKMIRNAFVELYRGLGLLKTYRFFNILQFLSFQLKKVSNERASASYLLAVKISHFISLTRW